MGILILTDQDVGSQLIGLFCVSARKKNPPGLGGTGG